jgi:hypothetical protein
LLGQDIAAEMLTPLVTGGYGLGTEVNDSAGYLRFGHDGGNAGYGCFSYAWPGAGAAVAVMVNSEDAREVLGSILATAERRYGAAAAPAEPVAPGDVTGRYLLRDSYPIDIAAVDGRLTFTAAGQPPAALRSLPDGGYRVAGLDCEIRFMRTDDELCSMELLAALPVPATPRIIGALPVSRRLAECEAITC